MATIPMRMAMIGCIAAALAVTPAFAGEQATGSFRVTASVPMACWVDHSVAVDARGTTPGLVTEGCNNASGYVVSALYRPLTGTETARLVYGDRMIDLSSAGAQEVHREYGPNIEQIAYHFDRVSLVAPLTLSLTIQPI